jgi:hypothetical protein
MSRRKDREMVEAEIAALEPDGLDPASRARPAAAERLKTMLEGLPDRGADELRREWRRLFRSHPPRHIRRDLLVLAIAWKLQERVHGGLTAADKRKLAGFADELSKNGDLSHSPAIRLKPGVRLVREWQGQTHTVTVLEDGFEWNGKFQSSLSAIAREITGTHWSGPRFFGLKQSLKPFGGKEWGNG